MVHVFDSLATAVAHLPVMAGFARVPVASRWQDSAWQLQWVRPVETCMARADAAAEETSAAADTPAGSALERVSNPVTLAVHRDEAEGCWLNVTATEPSIFVLWRAEDSQAPHALAATLSFNEASRWMDGGETVDRVPMPPEMLAWLADWVARAYEPQRRKRQRGEKPSFMGREAFAQFARGDVGALPEADDAPADPSRR